MMGRRFTKKKREQQAPKRESESESAKQSRKAIDGYCERRENARGQDIVGGCWDTSAIPI